MQILSVLLAIALLAGIMPLAMADENVPEAETPVQAEEQAQEEAAVPFTGRLTLFNCRPLIHGEMAYLKANVENANKSFSIFWDKLVQEEWERIPGAVGDCLSFKVDRTYGDYSYRAVLRAEDGTILTAEITVFVPCGDPHNEAYLSKGQCIPYTGIVRRTDPVMRRILLDQTEISFDDIIRIRILSAGKEKTAE